LSETPAIPIPGFVRQPVPPENSCRLARDISGIGVNTADAIAMKLDVREDAAGRHLLRLGQAMDFERTAVLLPAARLDRAVSYAGRAIDNLVSHANSRK
jgi:hypothetical protein